MRSLCTVEECVALVVGQGLCRKHYSRMKRNGRTDKIQQKRKCIVDGCDRWRASYGLCALHRAQAVAAQRGPTLISGRACVWCGAEVPATRSSRAMYCSTPCKHQAMNERHRQRPESVVERRDANLRIKFGISRETYNALLAAQNGCCAICGDDKPGGRGAFHVDHDHVTGRIRGLLCTRCNTGLGQFRDDPVLLEAAVRYLQHEARPIAVA